MREIKFRQQYLQNNSWHYWGWIDKQWINPKMEPNYQLPEESEQFTGLHDKNGKEIYEGDILQLTSKSLASDSPPIGIFTVEYFCDGFKLVYQPWDEKIRYNLGKFPNGFTKVIGTIYENPELWETE